MGNTTESEEKQLYVLQLTEGKYYVGVTNNLKLRLKQHKAGTGEGSEWTRKYGVLRLVEAQALTSSFEEDMKVKELMCVHGMENVRGGRYSRLILTTEERNLLEGEIEHALGLCYKCKQKGHFAANCPPVQTVATVTAPKQFPRKSKAVILCERCGRNNHQREKCYANTTLDGEKLCQGRNKNGLHCAKKLEGKYEYCFLHKDQA